jgi:hypothetical protein
VLWCANKKKRVRGVRRVRIGALSFDIYREIGSGSSLLEIGGLIYVSNLEEGMRKTVIRGYGSAEISLLLDKRLKEWWINGEKVAFKCERRGNNFAVGIEREDASDVSMEVKY